MRCIAHRTTFSVDPDEAIVVVEVCGDAEIFVAGFDDWLLCELPAAEGAVGASCALLLGGHVCLSLRCSHVSSIAYLDNFV